MAVQPAVGGPVPVGRSTVRAALFDLDGLLVDSEPVWSVAEAEIMSWLGGPWIAGVKAACLGRPIEVSCRELVRIAGSAVAPAAVQRRLLARMVDLFRADLPWQPGARELLDALAARGVPLALVSSRTGCWSMRRWRRWGSTDSPPRSCLLYTSPSPRD